MIDLIFLKVLVGIVSAIITLPILEEQRRYGKDISPDTLCLKGIRRIFLISTSITVSVLTFSYEREIWYAYLIPIAYAIIWQIIYLFGYSEWELMPIGLPFLGIILIICIIMPIRDLCLRYEPNDVPIEDVIIESIPVEMEVFLTEKEVQEILKAESISEPIYSDNKVIYEINENKAGYGVAVVDRASMHFYSCNYEDAFSGTVRNQYREKEIVKLGIVIEDDRPYTKYGILKRASILSRPQIDFYVLSDMKGNLKEKKR